MFTIACISITFCCSLFMCYYCIRLRIHSCISAWVCCMASQLNSYIYVRLSVSGLVTNFLIKKLLTTQPDVLAWPKSAAAMRSDNSLSDRTLYRSHVFQILIAARLKSFSKSDIAWFLSHKYLRQFYVLLYILLQKVSILMSLYSSKQHSRDIIRLVSCN